MKDINTIIENTIYNHVKSVIMEESEKGNKEVYHIKCEGEPIATFDTEEEANEELPKYKKSHPDKELIIEKGVYESHGDMIDKLDSMGEELEEKENLHMKNQEPMEGNSFIKAMLDAKEKGEETFTHDGETHDVKESWKELEEEEMMGGIDEEEECSECGDKGMSMEEGIFDMFSKNEGKIIDKIKYGGYEIDVWSDGEQKYFGHPRKENENRSYTKHSLVYNDLNSLIKSIDSLNKEESGEKTGSEDWQSGDEPMDMAGSAVPSLFPKPVKKFKNPDFKGFYVNENNEGMCSECGGELNEEGMCSECGSGMMEEEKGMCSECGGILNEEGMCSECGDGMMKESKKKKIRLKESELINLIGKMVTEAMKGDPGVPSIPGLTITKRAQSDSKKDNDSHIGDVEKKMKDYLSFDGNDNPEFPKQIGKGEKMAINNTPEQDDEVAKNFAGLQNLEYDIEPSENFKKRLKMAIEGDVLMGNAPTTEKPKLKPSNGADKGVEAKEKSGTSIPTPETAKKLEKQIKDRSEDKKKRTIYAKEKVPVDTKSAVNESSTKFSSLINEEIQKMKNLSSYDKKTQ